jgi:hypothetical protein
MKKTHSTGTALLLFSASAAVLFVFIFNRVSSAALPQLVYTGVGILHFVAYVVCLYFVFVSGRVTTFKFGWTVLLFFFGMFLFPIFWHRHLRIK